MPLVSTRTPQVHTTWGVFFSRLLALPPRIRMNGRLSLPIAFGAVATLAYREHRSRRALERVAAAALETLLNAIEANDEATGRHVRRVASYALVIADSAGLDDRRQRAVERVALFHDIGKIHEALFDIVHEERRLTAAERRAVVTHPKRGADVLAPLEAFYPELAAGVLAHHERWDGNGYPRGLRGSRIPLEARIVTIADTLDAVSRSRRYRRGGGFDAGLRVIAAGRGGQFDPGLVDLALLPPVAERLRRAFRSHVRHEMQSRQRSEVGHHRRAEQPRERVPDVAFRWRSESLGSRRIRASSHLD
jgi:HD-GYP domain-containing protein (c-di-GMP phosphodiesterase class II)